jgi:hypothetical protein
MAPRLLARKLQRLPQSTYDRKMIPDSVYMEISVEISTHAVYNPPLISLCIYTYAV